MTDGQHLIIGTSKGTVQGTCIKVWTRADNHQWIMSISSGPKECMVNNALALLDQNPQATAAALMHLPGPNILFLLEIDGRWQDIQGVIPKLTPVN